MPDNNQRIAVRSERFFAVVFLRLSQFHNRKSKKLSLSFCTWQ